jgi:chemotaxis protein MotB
MVAGYAATKPYVPADPYDPKNRRISLLLFQEPPPGGQDAAGGTAKDRGREQAGEAPQAHAHANEYLEREIDKIYDKATEKQF